MSEHVPEIYKCTLMYTVLISDIILMLECCRKFLETGDLKHVRYLCTIARVFSKKLASLNLTDLALPDLDRLSELCLDLCIDLVEDKREEAYAKLRDIGRKLEVACRSLLSMFTREVESYLDKVRSLLS